MKLRISIKHFIQVRLQARRFVVKIEKQLRLFAKVSN